jgi:hypothetical protein
MTYSTIMTMKIIDDYCENHKQHINKAKYGVLKAKEVGKCICH